MPRLPTLLAACLLCACADAPVDPHAGHPDAGDFGSTPIAPAPGEALWVVDGQGPGFTVVALDGAELPDGGVDPARIRVHGTVALAGVRFPHHVSLSPDRSFLVVADPGMDFSRGHNHADGGLGMDMPGALLKLDARTGQVLAGTRLARMNHNGAISADGREVWTTAMSNPGQVLVLDARTLAPLAQPITLTEQGVPQDGATEVSFSPDGRRAFVANGLSGTLSVLDVASRQVTATLRVGRDPVGAWPGADGLLYADNELGQTLSVVDPAGPSVLRSLTLGFTPGMAAATPEGQLWVSDSSNARVVVYPPGGSVPLGAVPTGEGAHGLAFSPSHRLLFVTNQWEHTLSVIDVHARQVIKELPTGKAPNGLVYRSP
ncbi:MAG TPA: YncE family protein [Aggregicoccus sp.]|nr:YncE family protein [Aggregicoccus sp.]